jgi:glycosyltransferase involved in cell wall biosynthesis
MDLSSALQWSYSADVNSHIMIPKSTNDIPEDMADIREKILLIPDDPQLTIRRPLEYAMARLFHYDFARHDFLRYHKIDVLFGPMISYRYGKIPTLSWITDFQHVHLPEMFQPSELRQRDRIFLRTARLSSRIILMSETVKKDFEAFAPQHAEKARVVKAVCWPPASVYESDPKSLTVMYDLPEKFVFLPNQFWKHKNHELVFKALKLLKDKGTEVFLVCAGYPGDYRNPQYFSDLLTRQSLWGIRNQMAVLGSIPRIHLLMLMRQAVCVLNPSLFEGFGLTVSEAQSVGKKVLLSDIPAHREQNPPQAIFFDPRNCEDFTEKLNKVWLEVRPGPDIELEKEARNNLPKRVHDSAESLMSVVGEVVRSGNNHHTYDYWAGRREPFQT